MAVRPEPPPTPPGDLEEAVRLDPSLASAHATLSHFYARMDDRSATVLAARRAYEEDAYLVTADEVLWRLIAGYYDQESFQDARRWCDVGKGRFPEVLRFTQCRLLLMTTRAAEPDVDAAWSLLLSMAAAGGLLMAPAILAAQGQARGVEARQGGAEARAQGEARAKEARQRAVGAQGQARGADAAAGGLATAMGTPAGAVLQGIFGRGGLLDGLNGRVPIAPPWR
jgi:hypothetical protein